MKGYVNIKKLNMVQEEEKRDKSQIEKYFDIINLNDFRFSSYMFYFFRSFLIKKKGNKQHIRHKIKISLFDLTRNALVDPLVI